VTHLLTAGVTLRTETFL